jgi:hypothetical protein
MTPPLSIVAIALAIFFAVLAWRLASRERSRSAARVVALGDAIDEITGTTPVEHVEVQPAFLAQEERPASSGGVVLKLAIGVGAVGLIVAIAMLGTSQARRAPDAATATAPVPAAVAATTPGGSLELLSMRHERHGDALTVTGLVRNGGSSPTDRLIAVVFLFNRNGDFVASGRAPLEFMALAPGDESPFRVSVPTVGEVGRYRVSFRTEAGGVRHVDRRQALVAHRVQ